MSHDDKLVYMANQIGKFFASQGADKAADGVATHLRKFWDPSMRRAIVAQLEAGQAEGLEPFARAAVVKIAGEMAAKAG
jgi:formate dehydrogenase subunit delta